MPRSRRIGLKMSAWSTSADRDRAPLGRDPAREAARRAGSGRPARPPPRCPSRRVATSSSAALVEQQERGRVGVQDLRDALEQLLQQLVERQVAERGVGDPLERLERAARRCARARTCGRARSPSPRGRRRTAAAPRRPAVNVRGVSVPTCRTPITSPSTSSGTPSSERMPRSRRIGLRMSAWSTSSIAIARALGCDPPREPAPDRDPDALLDLLLDALGRARDELVRRPRRAAGTRPCRCRRISVIRCSSSAQQVVEREVLQARRR